MNYEKYIPLYSDPEKGTVIRPKGEGATFSFHLSKEEGKAYKFYVAGETAQNYLKKCEPACAEQYHSIEDALDSAHAVHDAFALDFSSKAPEEYVKRCFKKILWKPMLYYLPMADVPTEWTIGIHATAENVEIKEGGYLRMRADIRLKKPGVEPKSTHGKADISYILDIPDGAYSFSELKKSITVPENAASVSLFLEGKRYSGTLYLEQPLLCANGENLAPDFAPASTIPAFNWKGQHFSRKEWPEFRIMLNGAPVFEGEIFERCHRSSDWEIPLPSEAVSQENTLTLSLTSDYHGALPYIIHTLAILETESAPFTVISVSETAPVGGKAYALIRTERDNIRLSLSACDAFAAPSTLFFEKAGLHGISLNALKPCVNASFTLSDGNACVTCSVGAIIHKEEDGVITGTGDMVFIMQDEYQMREYLSWYFANHIGNMITIRPTYRWSGTRYLNEKVMADAARLFNELGISYVHMADGRENPGLASCPPDSLIGGEFYLGRQNHECDGQLFYWHSMPLTQEGEAALDMTLEIRREEPERTARSDEALGTFENNSVYRNRSVNVPHDIIKAHDYTVGELKKGLDGATRHTGPSFTFKYFLEAGYKWLGAETMYSTEELLLAFLRGASSYGGNRKMGVHHAVQWSTAPHEREDHYRRYRIALYTSYMLGATDINTEEGLYRMEEYYERYGRHSECCKRHLAEQQDFYRYISRHTRSGSFYSNMAFLHGKYDGVNGFVPEKTWGFMNTPLTEAEKSWELLKLFYPDSRPHRDIYYRGSCPTDRPLGYNSFAPLGQVDVIPVEDFKDFSSYRVLAFLGYNLYDEVNCSALCRYVSEGGTLILTRAHLSLTTDYADIGENKHSFSPHSALSFTISAPEFAEDSFNGEALKVCVNHEDGESLVLTDSGRPLVIKYSLGKGHVILFNTPLYPSAKAIRPLYEAVLRDEKLRLNASEPFSVATDSSVAHTVYKQTDGSYHIYFTAVDWYREDDYLRCAHLSFGGHEYEITFPFGRMVKCVFASGRAVWADAEDGEILSVKGDTLKVQGIGKMNFHIAENGTVNKVPVDFSDSPVKEI